MVAPAPPLAAKDLWLISDPSQLWRARRFAEGAAKAFGFGEEDCYAFAFAANEAVSNAVEHGAPYDDGTVRLRIEEDGLELTFYVEDRGTFAPQVRTDDAISDRGRGLAFMAAVVDELEVKPVDEGTLVRLTKRRD
jgi:anti-sigma regulatory factor (Ser/Thr protein kinase)